MQFMQLNIAQAAKKLFDENSVCDQINENLSNICSVNNLHLFNLYEIRAKYKNLIPS